LDGWGLAGLADAAELVLSELLTNAVRHSAARTREVGTSYERDGTGGVRLEVSDGSPVTPQLRTAALDAENGRGLGLVDMVTGGRWGVASNPHGGGKTVWARIAAI
jgi:anti-sigma regulatory factor (Ser/Thr protein kinase)